MIMNFTGLNAASLSTAQSYISAFEQLAKTNNTLILPSNVSDVSGVVGSAVSIYQNLSKSFQTNSNSGTEKIEVESIEENGK